jgi:hypothetical protein
MPDYKFYVLAPEGHMAGATVIDCPDDTAAFARARKLLGTFNAAVEAWHGSRKVVHVGQLRGFSDATHLMAPRQS